MKLNIYKDETFTEVQEVREVERIKIPLRAAQYVMQAAKEYDLKNENEILRAVVNSEEQLVNTVRATFGLAEHELDYVDTVELGDVGKEIYKWVIEKLKDMGIQLNFNDPNQTAPVEKN